MRITALDRATGETVTVASPITLTGTRSDFKQLFNAIGGFFGGFDEQLRFWPAPEGVVQIQIEDPPQPGQGKLALHSHGEPLEPTFASLASTADDAKGNT